MREIGKEWDDGYGEMLELMGMMLEYNPQKRIRPKDALKHGFFKVSSVPVHIYDL